MTTPHQRRFISTASPLLQQLYARFVDNSNERVKEILISGANTRGAAAFLARIMAYAAEQQAIKAAQPQLTLVEGGSPTGRLAESALPEMHQLPRKEPA